MKTRASCMWALVCAAAVVLPSRVGAQVPEAPAPAVPESPAGVLAEPPILEYDLSGPRFGATMDPKGNALSQFGWHFEHSVAPAPRGPWFVVETVLLVGGVDRNLFVPSGTLIFGMRLPNSFEFGVGPSLTVGGSSFARSGIVIAAGQSFRIGAIRVPVNVAFAPGAEGDHRVSVVAGWAIRDRATYR